MIKKYPLLPFFIFATFVAGTATVGLPVFASVGWFGSRNIYLEKIKFYLKVLSPNKSIHVMFNLLDI